MARTILVAGTASHVGKSTVAAGLCRLFADRGVDVAPFKAQNMSNNARAVPRADGEGFGEIGVSQYVQARAARVRPTTDHNPVLLKPHGEGASQLVLDGEAVARYDATDYFEDHWGVARETAVAAYDRLAAAHDVIVAEGAGAIAEPNLLHRDLANVETARVTDAEVLLVADIERGGVFASLVGTLELLPEDLCEQVVGVVVTKFRGDRSILQPAIGEFEERTGVPILGVLPHDDPGLPAEDSVGLPPADGDPGTEPVVRGANDGVPDPRTVTIAVPRWPRISNATDLEPLSVTPGVRVAYLPLNGRAIEERLPRADAVVLPGTKNTVDDLQAARAAGLGEALGAFDGPIVGLCGGYQFLGERVHNADVEGTETEAETVAAFGLLPVETTFSGTKRVAATELELTGVGPLKGARGTVFGYEIHVGETRVVDTIAARNDVTKATDGEGNAEGNVDETGGDVVLPFSDGNQQTARFGAARGDVLGTYLHGLFENDAVREAFVNAVYESAGVCRPAPDASTPEFESSYDRAAALLCEHADLDDLGVPRRHVS